MNGIITRRIAAIAAGTLCALALALPTAAQNAAIGPEIRAQLTPRQSTVISSEIAGKIASLPLRDGDRFEKGQMLAALDCGINKNRLSRAQASRDRALRIHETKDQLNAMRSIGRLEVDVAASELAEAEAELGLMRMMVERCTITAPFGGRISGVTARAHQFVAEGEPLLEILDDRDLEVEMIVPSPWLTRIMPGFPFRIAVDETGRTYEAEVTRLSGRVDPVSQSIRIYGRVLGEHAELMAGMSGRAVLDLAAVAGGPATTGHAAAAP